MEQRLGRVQKVLAFVQEGLGSWLGHAREAPQVAFEVTEVTG
jgi:hypothetical protein